MLNKAGKIFCIVVTIALIVSVYYNYTNSKKENRIKEVFVSNLASEVNIASSKLSSIKSYSRDKISDYPNDNFQSIIDQLNRLDSFIMDSRMMTDNNVYYIDQFRHLANCINTGSEVNNKHIFDGFMADGKLSQNEVEFLNSVGKDLKRVRDKLYSSETKQANIKLSFKEVNDILLPIVSKYESQNFENLKVSN